MSDHISGPRALADPIADITDVYAFPSPERPGHLVLVQNTLPFASATATFSDGLVYRFRLRAVAVIERALIDGGAHATCGGRALNDDMMDTMLTLLINAGSGPVVRDGVDQASRPASEMFPYLATPNPSPPAQPEHR